MDKIHTLTHTDGDKLRFIDYDAHGVTVELTYSGETLDFGFGPDEIPALIEWLQNTQKEND